MTDYIGRFAPSPSGPLHFGSLVAALGSWLRARSQQGLWLLRMEDIDPPREMAGAADDILRTLERFGLTWDDDVLYQSQRHQAYDDTLQRLMEQEMAYYCDCPRRRIRQLGGLYDGHCRHRQLRGNGCATRLVNDHGVTGFEDRLLGPITTETGFAEEDFIIHRRDGLYAYQLAVVVDDAFQGITEVVRGNDLLETTVRQQTLQRILGLMTPDYLHLPLAVWADGNKLSKQNHAPAIGRDNPERTLSQALTFLGLAPEPELSGAPCATQLTWAVNQFSLERLPRERKILLSPA
ncbi:tRNA glutamyl-Q(34) synthetase GluQRS [Ferrimonas sediminicola]|uniref:Glutamyl-Q tRNA(Asp) synthetase n=1 Tax=Ferrimonas sediminicola TaxID=2569538 RepID=A0A4U1BIZ0_9GAMM|nr:tRNA glutamyl-Q(34) synthetase GluQRS [Ferrimonas sediminicola]TKB51486.1 tRNA glutamyl-Q(34) synthetase GluQRS [Ferrimonas sediminicola]